jgi:hypothetical protein
MLEKIPGAIKVKRLFPAEKKPEQAAAPESGEQQEKQPLSDEEKAAAQETYQKGVDAYNAAVSKEEEVAGQFNTEIREYKAANPG